MKLITLVNAYMYTFDIVEIYNVKDGVFQYSTHDIKSILDTYIKRFNIYETEKQVVLEIWV